MAFQTILSRPQQFREAHGLEPYRYLRHVFKELPRAQSLEEIEQLLPWHVDKEQINNGWAKKVDGV